MINQSQELSKQQSYEEYCKSRKEAAAKQWEETDKDFFSNSKKPPNPPDKS